MARSLEDKKAELALWEHPKEVKSNGRLNPKEFKGSGTAPEANSSSALGPGPPSTSIRPSVSTCTPHGLHRDSLLQGTHKPLLTFSEPRPFSMEDHLALRC